MNIILNDGDSLCINTNVGNYPLVSELSSGFVMNVRQYTLILGIYILQIKMRMRPHTCNLKIALLKSETMGS